MLQLGNELASLGKSWLDIWVWKGLLFVWESAEEFGHFHSHGRQNFIWCSNLMQNSGRQSPTMIESQGKSVMDRSRISQHQMVIDD